MPQSVLVVDFLIVSERASHVLLHDQDVPSDPTMVVLEVVRCPHPCVAISVNDGTIEEGPAITEPRTATTGGPAIS
jgi:hypothetical protein